jgi:hypothetical protein
MAVVMAVDLGLGRPYISMRNLFFGSDHTCRALFPNPDSIEARRTWLGCYYLAARYEECPACLDVPLIRSLQC